MIFFGTLKILDPIRNNKSVRQDILDKQYIHMTIIDIIPRTRRLVLMFPASLCLQEMKL